MTSRNKSIRTSFNSKFQWQITTDKCKLKLNPWNKKSILKYRVYQPRRCSRQWSPIIRNNKTKRLQAILMLYVRLYICVGAREQHCSWTTTLSRKWWTSWANTCIYPLKIGSKISNMSLISSKQGLRASLILQMQLSQANDYWYNFDFI